MIDRAPTYPGRVTMTPVAGQANTYDLVMADEPTEAGTPLCKATLLSDATAIAIDSTTPPSTPDAALTKLLSKIAAIPTQYCEVVQYTGTGTSESVTRLAETTYQYLGDTYYSVAGLMLDKTITFSREPKAVILLSMQYFRINGYGLLIRPVISNVVDYWHFNLPIIFNFNKPSNFPLSEARQMYNTDVNTFSYVQLSQKQYDDLYYATYYLSGLSNSRGIHKDGNIVKFYRTGYISKLSYAEADTYLASIDSMDGYGVNNSNYTYAAIAFF